MNFKTATEMMERGLKVRPSYWKEDNYLYSDRNVWVIRERSGTVAGLSIAMIWSDEWEIYNPYEQWSLCPNMVVDTNKYLSKDIHKLKKIIFDDFDKMVGECETIERCKGVIEERFGFR